jgi:hypothetical protein
MSTWCGIERPVLFVVGMGQSVDVAPCRLVNGDRRFEETYWIPLSGPYSPRCVFLVPLALKTMAVRSFETSVTNYQSTRRRIPAEFRAGQESCDTPELSD